MAVERYDVLDRDGNRTYENMPRDLVHGRGVLHPGVHVWITDGLRVLMARRDAGKALMGGTWDIIAGHVAAGETTRNAGVREVREEAGLLATPDQLHFFGTSVTDMAVPAWGGAHHRTREDNYVWYRSDLYLGDVTPEDGSINTPTWVDLDQLEADMRSEARARDYALREPTGPALFALGVVIMRQFEGGPPEWAHPGA